MTRWGLAFTVLVALALVVLAASAFYDSSNASGQGGAYAAQVGTIGADWVHIEWYQDSAGGLHFVLAQATVYPTPTAPPTNTPRPVASVTPTPTPTATTRPTDTPEPTNTPVYTSTPTLAPTATTTPAVTPTQETGIPTPAATDTPAPWPTSTPNADICTGTPALNWFIRSGPGSSYSKLGYFDTANDPARVPPAVTVQRFRLEAYSVDANGTGWYAFWLSESVYGWTAAGAWTLSGDCTGLPGDVPALLVGPHLLFNANADRLATLLASSGVVKEVSGDGKLLMWARLLNPDTVTIYRYVDGVVGSCSPDWMDGRQWFDTLYARWPKGADWYELENECGDESRAYSNTHVIETMQAANEAGVCLLLYSFGVGTPSLEMFAATKPVWDWALAHECQPGRHHALAMHAYGLNFPRENIWLFSGWKMRCDALPGYCQRVGIWFTEWEWYANESDPVSCAQVVDNIRWARTEYKNSPVRAVLLWSFGDLQPWRNLTPCAEILANDV